MDFGTIQKKLNLNIYNQVDEFLNDMSLVFNNCRLYNGVDSYVGKIGVNVRKEYDRLLGMYNFVERFQNSGQVHPSFLITEELQNKLKANEQVKDPIEEKENLVNKQQTQSQKNIQESTQDKGISETQELSQKPCPSIMQTEEKLEERPVATEEPIQQANPVNETPDTIIKDIEQTKSDDVEEPKEEAQKEMEKIEEEQPQLKETKTEEINMSEKIKEESDKGKSSEDSLLEDNEEMKIVPNELDN